MKKNPASQARAAAAAATGAAGELPAALRSIEVLQLVAQMPGQLSLTDLATLMRLSKSTVHRLVEQLTRAGFLVREADQRHLWIGRRLRELSLDVVHNDFLRSAVRNVLRSVADEVGETCNIATLDGTEVVYLQRVEARWPLRLTLDLDSRIPVHCCASGKLLLALMDAARRQRVLRSITLEALTPATLTTEPALEAELERIRATGYALDQEEFLPGMVAIALPVLGADKRIRATLSVHAPTVRCSTAQELERWVPLLKRSARSIERAIQA
jgi:DNA-binding IclR family transcriptional regulator